MDVRKLTSAVMLLASLKLDLHNKLDNDMFNHVTFVTNRILMLAKKDGVNKETLEDMGKYLWRLFNVMLAYNNKQKDVTLDSVISIVSEFRAVFAG